MLKIEVFVWFTVNWTQVISPFSASNKPSVSSWSA